jgi:uncharacterized lipoprotein
MVKPKQRLRSAIMQVVDNQLAANDPPETNQTLARLVAAGFSESAARELIGTVVVAEVFAVLQRGEPFDHGRYVAALDRLPETP